LRTEAIVLRAERAPLAGVQEPGPHQLYRHPSVAVETRDLGPLADDALRVEMLLAGICGTDLHAAGGDPETGYILGSAPLSVGRDGRVLGHEGVGRVIEAGAAVRHVSPGRVVTFESIVGCRHCPPCRRGDLNQCENGILLGMEQDGLFATVADVPASIAHDVTDLAARDGGLPAAACLEPAACAHVACSICRVSPGDAVVVFGAGPIGLFAAMLARLAFGAASVHVVEPVAFRRDLAGRWADRVHDAPAFFADPPNGRFDVLIEASGDVTNVDRAFPRLGRNARVALLARSGRPVTLTRIDQMITGNISIAGSRGHLGGAFDSVLSLVRANRLPLHDAVTEIVDGLDGLRDRLLDPERVLNRNCKILVRLDAGARPDPATS